MSSAVANGTGSVVAIEECRLILSGERWEFAQARQDDIDAYWERRLDDNPDFFNGTIYLTRSAKVEGDVFSADLFATDFKNFLYWRENGYGDRTVTDVFGSALIVSADGAVILGRQRVGNINSGLAYCPGGLVDARDVAADGYVDIRRSIRRELHEETGLEARDVEDVPGFLLTRLGQQISIAAEFRSALAGDVLRERILDYLSADPRSELVDVDIVSSLDATRSLAMPDFMHPLLTAYFGGVRSGGGS